MTTTIRVVLDSDVIYGINLTDLFMTMANLRVCEVHWSAQIIDDAKRNLLRNRPDLKRLDVERRFELMNMALPDANVEVAQSLIDEMPNHDNDKHVMAAAVTCGAAVIVSNNVRHFPAALLRPFDLRACRADEFVEELANSDIATLCEVVAQMAHRRKNPSIESAELVLELSRSIPVSASLIRTALQADPAL